MKVVRTIAAALGFSLLAGAGSAQGPVVVELFTSQGCSNCPPVDALLAELADHEDVIALALHVDYWDYIGWADTFANPAYSARQNAYAYAAGSTVVYTPQIIIGGAVQMVGHEPMAVVSQIMEYVEMPDPVSIDITQDGDTYRMEAQLVGEAPSGGMLVQLVRYSPHEQVSIQRGENADRTLDYHNIVRDWQVVAEWDGRTTFSAEISRLGAEPHVVIIQAAGNGPILAAARLD